MAHESFEDEEVAVLLNQDYVCIKVDREERPDIDHIYMSVCQAMTGHGGWPLTIIMTPERKPFFAATYLPKRGGRTTGLMELLPRVAKLWQEQKDAVLDSSEKIYAWMQDSEKNATAGEVSKDLLEQAWMQLSSSFDRKYGGFGNAPKFPSPHNLMFLLRYHVFTGNEKALEIVEKTLESMFRGGIYDHIGFGFARYSTDHKWLVPHFEKMLYDNALLAIAYLEAYQLTGKSLYSRVAQEIFTYVLRDMTSPEGGFYSAEDADSEGEEGKFYVWTVDEVIEVLGESEGKRFCSAYDITRQGNFEGKNIPNLIGEGELAPESFATLRERLFAFRKGRVHPHKDDKILTSWNGLMIAALAIGARVLKKPEYLEAAEKAADFIRQRLQREDGRLLASYRQGQIGAPAFAGDYTNLIWGLLELYQAGFKATYLETALKLNRDLLKYFWDSEQGGIFLYGDDAEQLAARPRDWFDGAMPSANSVAALNFLRLSRLTGDPDLMARSQEQLEVQAGVIEKMPASCTFYLLAVCLFLSKPRDVVIVGKADDADAQKMMETLNTSFQPFTIAVFKDIREDSMNRIMPHTADMKMLEGKATAYICENFACQSPTNDLADFQKT